MLSCWEPRENDPLSPPYFTHQSHLAKFISVADVSQNGLCGILRFPSPLQVLKRGTIDDKVSIHLPMQKPFILSMEIRWTKRIRERVESPDGSTKHLRSYRFGAEFLNPSQDVQLFIRQFIQQLSQQGAV